MEREYRTVRKVESWERSATGQCSGNQLERGGNRGINQSEQGNQRANIRGVTFQAGEWW